MIRVGLLYVDNFEQNRSRHVGSLGLAYIAAYLQKHLPEVEIEIGIYPQDLDHFNADVVGISAYSETLPMAVEYAEYIKARSNVPLVLGGPHLASNPFDLPAPFDMGVAGEGEALFLQIVRWVQDKKELSPALYQGVLGLTYRHEGQAVAQGRCPPLDDMDSLAHPNRPLMYAAMKRHFPDFTPMIHLHTARGCPYRCTFCSAPLVNPKWRFHSPEWVVEELQILAEQFPECRELTLSDDLFTLKKSRLEALVKAIQGAGLNKRFFFFCSSRSNTMTAEMCRLLRDMNILMVSFGFESASDVLIKDLKGVGTSRGDYERVIQLCQSHGIYSHGNFIIGSQKETRPDLFQTYEFVLSNQDRFSSVYFSHMTPFPGTKVWDDAEASDLIPANLDYKVLNLEYKRGDSVFLNQHYDQDFYEAAFPKFTKLTTELNDRYYAEQVLLKDMIWKERFALPEQILGACQHLGWNDVAIVSDEYYPIEGLETTFYKVGEIVSETHDVIFLPHTLEQMRTHELFLVDLPALPIFSLHYHMANFYDLSLLLQNKWEEGVFGLRQRRFLHYFTLKTLSDTMSKKGYVLQNHLKLNYETELCPKGILQTFEQLFKTPDLTTFAYLTLFNKPI